MVKPWEIDGLTGVIAMELIVALLTVKLKVADTLPTVAVRMAVPGAMPNTRFGLTAGSNFATSGLSLDQTTLLVTSPVNRLEKLPVAESLVEVLAAIVEETAVISIEVRGMKSLADLLGAPSKPQPDNT